MLFADAVFAKVLWKEGKQLHSCIHFIQKAADDGEEDGRHQSGVQITPNGIILNKGGGSYPLYEGRKKDSRCECAHEIFEQCFQI